jgi:hypothetical protein
MKTPELQRGLDAREIMRLVEHYRTNCFEDPEELLDFIEAFWGIKVPRARVCHEHTPPAEYIVDPSLKTCWIPSVGPTGAVARRSTARW